MNNTTIGILSNNLKLSTQFVEKIIINTKAIKDQDHIKMNIIINNKLLDKNNKFFRKLLKNIEKSQVDYLVLIFNDINIYNYLKDNTSIPIINSSFDINDIELVKKIIKLTGKELKK